MIQAESLKRQQLVNDNFQALLSNLFGVLLTESFLTQPAVLAFKSCQVYLISTFGLLAPQKRHFCCCLLVISLSLSAISEFIGQRELYSYRLITKVAKNLNKRSHTFSLAFVLAFCLLSCSKRAAREAKRKNDQNSRSIHCLRFVFVFFLCALLTASSRGKMQQLPIILCCSPGSFSLLLIFSVVCSNLHTKVSVNT